MTIDNSLLALLITTFIALLSFATWVGALHQKVKQNKEDIASDRMANRNDHRLIFDKLEEINKYIRNGR